MNVEFRRGSSWPIIITLGEVETALTFLEACGLYRMLLDALQPAAKEHFYAVTQGRCPEGDPRPEVSGCGVEEGAA